MDILSITGLSPRTLREVYDQASNPRGGASFNPPAVHVNGEVLNRLFTSTRFPPEEQFTLTLDGKITDAAGHPCVVPVSTRCGGGCGRDTYSWRYARGTYGEQVPVCPACWERVNHVPRR